MIEAIIITASINNEMPFFFIEVNISQQTYN